MSKPLKEDYIIRIKSRIEQRLDEPAAEEEKEEFVELMTRGSLVLKGGSYYVTYRETETTGYEGCTTAGWRCCGSARAAGQAPSC